MFLYSEAGDDAKEWVLKNNQFNTERIERIAREKEMIQSACDPQEVFGLLRKPLERLNEDLLIGKALEYEEEILPMVIDKLIRSGQDIFIDNAVQIIAKSQKDYTWMLKDRFEEIRSNYARSMVCIVFGLRQNEDIIPWLVDIYYEMKKQYPKEEYCQGPLVALYELNRRFVTQ